MASTLKPTSHTTGGDVTDPANAYDGDAATFCLGQEQDTESAELTVRKNEIKGQMALRGIRVDWSGTIGGVTGKSVSLRAGVGSDPVQTLVARSASFSQAVETFLLQPPLSCSDTKQPFAIFEATNNVTQGSATFRVFEVDFLFSERGSLVVQEG